MRELVGGVATLVTLLVALVFASAEPAFAQTAASDQYASAASDQYASAASDQYQNGTSSGQMPVGPNDPTHPSLTDPESSQSAPSRMPANPDDPADPGHASGASGAFDQVPKDVSPNLDSTGQSLTPPNPSSASTAGTTGSEPDAAPPSSDAWALGDVISSLSALLDAITPSTTPIGNLWGASPGASPAVADQCVPGPSVLCVGGGDPLPPPTVVDQCTPGPGVVCVGGGAPSGPAGSFTGGAGSPAGPVPYLIDALVRQANDSMITDWLVDDPGDGDGDGAVSTDLNPGSYDADPTDHDGDGRVLGDSDRFDPDE